MNTSDTGLMPVLKIESVVDSEGAQEAPEAPEPEGNRKLPVIFTAENVYFPRFPRVNRQRRRRTRRCSARTMLRRVVAAGLIGPLFAVMATNVTMTHRPSLKHTIDVMWDGDSDSRY